MLTITERRWHCQVSERMMWQGFFLCKLNSAGPIEPEKSGFWRWGWWPGQIDRTEIHWTPWGWGFETLKDRAVYPGDNFFTIFLHIIFGLQNLKFIAVLLWFWNLKCCKNFKFIVFLSWFWSLKWIYIIQKNPKFYNLMVIPRISQNFYLFLFRIKKPSIFQAKLSIN